MRAWLRRPDAAAVRRNDIVALCVLLLACAPAYLLAAPFAFVTVLLALLAAPFADNATLAFALMCIASLFGLAAPPTAACACRGAPAACVEIDGSLPDCHTTVNFRVYLQITLLLGAALWLVNARAYLDRRVAPPRLVLALCAALCAHTWLAHRRAHWLPGLYVADEPFCRLPMQRCSVMVGGLICVALTLVAALCAAIRAVVAIRAESSRQQPVRTNNRRR
jgi:hypothetical protein